jgi:hypothetical protein
MFIVPVQVTVVVKIKKQLICGSSAAIKKKTPTFSLAGLSA